MSQYIQLNREELLNLLTKKTLRYNQILKHLGENPKVEAEEYHRLRIEMGMIRKEIDGRKFSAY